MLQIEQFIRRAAGQLNQLLTGMIVAVSRASACRAEVRLLEQSGVWTPRAASGDWLLFVREQGDCGNCNKSDQIKEKLMFVRTSNESRSLRIDRDDAELAPCKRTHIFHFIPTKYVLLPN